MAVRWFVIRNAKVRGWGESSAAEPPPPKGQKTFPAIDDAQFATYETVLQTIADEGRSDLPGWDGTNAFVPPDTRNTYTIVPSKNHVNSIDGIPDNWAGGNLTFDITGPAGNIQIEANYEGKTRYFRFSVPEVKAFNPAEPGTYRFSSNDRYILNAPITVHMFQ